MLLPGRAAIFAHEDVPTLSEAYRGLLVAGAFEESVGDASNGLTLRNRAGDVVADWDLLALRQISEITGRPGRSGLVSLVATQTSGAPGYLQISCTGSTPGSTSNLNVDGPRAERA